MSKIYVIHENSEWLPPFAEAFDVEGVAWEEWYLGEGAVALVGVAPAAPLSATPVLKDVEAAGGAEDAVQGLLCALREVLRQRCALLPAMPLVPTARLRVGDQVEAKG